MTTAHPETFDETEQFSEILAGLVANASTEVAQAFTNDDEGDAQAANLLEIARPWGAPRLTTMLTPGETRPARVIYVAPAALQLWWLLEWERQGIL